VFFIEWDKIDQEEYFLKIPFGSFEQDDKSQKLNLALAWSPVQTALNSKCDIILMLYVSLKTLPYSQSPIFPSRIFVVSPSQNHIHPTPWSNCIKLHFL
jgi:hypothetical protein